eukprot:g39013.t1
MILISFGRSEPCLFIPTIGPELKSLLFRTGRILRRYAITFSKTADLSEVEDEDGGEDECKDECKYEVVTFSKAADLSEVEDEDEDEDENEYEGEDEGEDESTDEGEGEDEEDNPEKAVLQYQWEAKNKHRQIL